MYRKFGLHDKKKNRPVCSAVYFNGTDNVSFREKIATACAA